MKGYTNQEYLNSKNHIELANVNSVGKNILLNNNQNNIPKINHNIPKPKIVNSNLIHNNENNTTENLKMKKKKKKFVIPKIEPNETTNQLDKITNASKNNNVKVNNVKVNNINVNNDTICKIQIILNEIKEIFPLGVMISILIFMMIFIYIIKF